MNIMPHIPMSQNDNPNIRYRSKVATYCAVCKYSFRRMRLQPADECIFQTYG